MKNYLRFLGCVVAMTLLATIPAVAQSISYYANSDYDGTYVTVTGVLQYTANNCYWCSSASHTYQQTAQVTSPSGRNASCSFYYEAGAASDQNLTCEALLPDNGETGDFVINDNPSIICSAVGTLLNATAADVIELHASGYALSDPVACRWIPWGTNCPGVSSQAHNTIGCGSPFKQCRDSYNRTTGVWTYRRVCVGQPGYAGLLCN